MTHHIRMQYPKITHKAPPPRCRVPGKGFAPEGPRARRRILRACALLCALLLLLTGCKPTGGGAPPADSTAAEPLHTLLASFYPAYLAAATLTHGMADMAVDVMAQPQAGLLENYILSQPDYDRIAQSGAFLCVGGGLEPFMAGVAASGVCPVIAAAEDVARIPRATYAEEPAENPYVWLSPELWIDTLTGAAAALCYVDVSHAQAYTENLVAAVETLAACVTRIEALRPLLAGRACVILHPAGAYFATAAGLDIALAIDRDPAYAYGQGDYDDLHDALLALPGPLADLPKTLVFVENEAPAALVRALEDAGCAVVRLQTLCAGVPDARDALAVWLEAFDANMGALHDAAFPPLP